MVFCLDHVPRDFLLTPPFFFVLFWFIFPILPCHTLPVRPSLTVKTIHQAMACWSSSDIFLFEFSCSRGFVSRLLNVCICPDVYLIAQSQSVAGSRRTNTFVFLNVIFVLGHFFSGSPHIRLPVFPFFHLQQLAAPCDFYVFISSAFFFPPLQSIHESILPPKLRLPAVNRIGPTAQISSPRQPYSLFLGVHRIKVPPLCVFRSTILPFSWSFKTIWWPLLVPSKFPSPSLLLKRMMAQSHLIFSF